MDSELPRHQGGNYCLVFLGEHKKGALTVVSFVLEAILVVGETLVKNKLVAAVILSTSGIIVYTATKGGALAATMPRAERQQRRVVEILFFAIQLMVTMAHYGLIIWGVNMDYIALVFMTAYPAIPVVFVFLKDEEVANSSHDQTHSNSSREEPIESVASNDPNNENESVASNDPNNENGRVNMRSNNPFPDQSFSAQSWTSRVQPDQSFSALSCSSRVQPMEVQDN